MTEKEKSALAIVAVMEYACENYPMFRSFCTALRAVLEMPETATITACPYCNGTGKYAAKGGYLDGYCQCGCLAGKRLMVKE